MTDLKRVVIYLSPEEKAEVDRIAKAMGQSKSSVCGDVVREAIPHLRVVAQAVELAKTDPAQALKMIRAAGMDSQMSLIQEMKALDD